MTRDHFHRWIADPRTGPLLTQALDELARIEDVPTSADGPMDCCAAYSVVTSCNGIVDVYTCPVCSRTFTARCPDQDVMRWES